MGDDIAAPKLPPMHSALAEIVVAATAGTIANGFTAEGLSVFWKQRAAALAVRQHEVDAPEPRFLGIEEDAANMAIAIHHVVVAGPIPGLRRWP